MDLRRVLIPLLLAILALWCVFCCPNDDDDDNDTSDRDYKQDMRTFVGEISAYAKAIRPGFAIIPQNGQELLTRNGEEDGSPATEYIAAIDGVGREDLLYGYNDDNEPTPVGELNYMLAFLSIAKSRGLQVLVTDYCWARAYVDDSYSRNEQLGFVSFAADSRELDTIPLYPFQPNNFNTAAVTTLLDARNFLYVLNPDQFADKEDFLNALRNTSYDLIIMDLFIFEHPLTASEVASLKSKAAGGERLVVAYMSIGEAEDYRYYWQESWTTAPPSWLEAENPDWPGNYKVKYWDPEWQAVIFGNDASYTHKILEAGFDGIYLDIIDAFEYFE